MSLWSDFLTNDQRVIHKLKHYFPVYERHFSPWVNKPVTFLEIGVGEGGSLQMWKRYFGPHARIVGIDTNPACKAFEEDQIEIHIGSQSSAPFLANIVPDIVLDDGSHIARDMIASFRLLYPRMNLNGVYMVEDLCCAYWPEYQIGESFLALCLPLIDELNADHTRGVVPPTDFTRSTLSMHFYDSCVVFERGRHTPNTELRTGR